MTILNLLIAWIPVVLWAGLIFALSAVPGLGAGWSFPDLFFRKMAHVGEYFVLTLLTARALYRTGPARTARSVALVAGTTALLYAVSDEFHQRFVPNRGPSPVDVLIDSVGILSALGVMRRWPHFLVPKART